MIPLARIAAATALLVSTTSAAHPTTFDPSADKSHESDAHAIWNVRLRVKEALQTGDTQLMMSLWIKECSFVQFVDDQTKKYTGWQAVKRCHDEMFHNLPNMRVTFDRVGLHFVTPEVAIEDCTYVVALPGNQSAKGRDTTVLVKRNGRWFIAAVRDSAPSSAHTESDAER
jgi:uncharacterized protein (TIGR02246 family)